MSEFSLYNTMSRRVEPFAPADGETVRMYTCGPTVYKPAHIGNYRTFLFEDLLRRTLRLRGWRVEQVMNLTDVDDKIIKSADEERRSIREITEPITELFHRDRRYMRIEDAEVYPKATEHIPEMIALVGRLMDRGLAYQAEDGSIYYAISKFSGYGKLSRLDTRTIKPGARVAADDYNKEDVRDFALWKAAKPEDERTGAAWDSPWGRGRPGWHLECSAMAMKYLGETLDLHCGGVDLIFPHHEDEIAQSEGATGVAFARTWCHGEFLLVESSKMAKRVGNVVTVETLRERKIPGVAARHLMFGVHYRQQLNLKDEALEASVQAVRRIGEFADRLDKARSGTPELGRAAEDAERGLRAALFDDLNAPEAVAALFTFIRRANAELDRGGSDDGALDRARAAFAAMDGVLDLRPRGRAPVRGLEIRGELAPVTARGSPQDADGDEDRERLAEWVEGQLAARREARAARDFSRADAIRRELEERGIEVKDVPGGTEWRVVRGG